MGMALGLGDVETRNAVRTDSGAPPADPGVVVADPRRWYALGVIAIAQLMVVLDSSIVNLALPSAKADLGISDANQQWVVTAYTLAFGGLLLLGGRVADFVGRKRMFIIGLLGFAAASALGGLAPTQGLLFAARALQGGFGAFLVPAALSLLTVTFHDPKERAKAFGVYGAIAGGGAAIGLLLGGVLTEDASWRWCLRGNVPSARRAGRPLLAVDEQQVRPAVAVDVEDRDAAAEQFRVPEISRCAVVMNQAEAGAVGDVGEDDRRPGFGGTERRQRGERDGGTTDGREVLKTDQDL